MRISLLAAALAGLCILASCQTPYQDGGFAGGVTASAITNDTFRISARGNGYTAANTIQDYVLLKAAETTLASGGTHFVVLTSADATQNMTGQTPGYMQTNVIGNTAYSTYTPGVTYNVVKPGQDTIIKIINVPTGISPPMGAFPAQQVFDNINPRVIRPKKK
ncbi:hypothetical protein IHQ71_18660 [Rhizobium sp. TH2]|uniref:CC0125/CC1285 family lipoprotein n=1 Tax=Rhizobium sp. TH2 TaxID=2775403 RepID=UPI0021587395|nr:hypothetical protein [Rhizobium sp. TH2]UVC07229.1 hypothetical protein IHQ71_18660 [Rhizobium sp. TH2]